MTTNLLIIVILKQVLKTCIKTILLLSSFILGFPGEEEEILEKPDLINYMRTEKLMIALYYDSNPLCLGFQAFNYKEDYESLVFLRFGRIDYIIIFTRKKLYFTYFFIR